MTFSITARCPTTGMFGIAVTSSSMAVAARCAFVRAGVGAVASQNITDPRLGPRGLDLMAGGKTAAEALDVMLEEHAHGDYRQLVLVDGAGGVAHHSGRHTLGTHGVVAGEVAGEAAVAAGNLLASPTVPAAMIEAFQDASAAPFPARLLSALEGGLRAGGEAGPVRSAGLLVAHREAWPLVDLRVDWSEDDPIAALAAVWRGWAPQMDDYVTRALDPTAAPTYGVPGDE
jgi:uncharacterized Ntn-hydrolase superfamily protein